MHRMAAWLMVNVNSHVQGIIKIRLTYVNKTFTKKNPESVELRALVDFNQQSHPEILHERCTRISIMLPSVGLRQLRVTAGCIHMII